MKTSMNNKIVILSAHPLSLQAFMLPHIRQLHIHWPIEAMANTPNSRLLIDQGVDVLVVEVPLKRAIAPLADLKALWVLFWRFRRSGLTALHTITPKAGLLGMLAGWLAGVPIRVHSFTGQVWVTRRGLKRWVLKAADKCIVALATDVLVDSPSQRAFLITEGVVSEHGSRVLGLGSICGVDTQRFSPSPFIRQTVRADMGTASDAVVCLYLGRLNRDKGVLDLAAAFAKVAANHPKAELWVVGPDEGDMFAQMQSVLGVCSQHLRRVGYTNEPERFMQAADLFCLPSYREGFGSSVIEAAACGVPALVSRIYGLTDAVVEGETGWMHEAGNVQDLTAQLDDLLNAPAELKHRGEAARAYVEQVFEQSLIINAMLNFYKNRLNTMGVTSA
jgi:glycosyltransferase involved in cell wall biosynthesis